MKPQMKSGSRTSLVLSILCLLSFIGRFVDSHGGVSNFVQPSFRGNRSLKKEATSDSPTPTPETSTSASTENITASDTATGGASMSVGTITDNMLVSSPQMPIPFTLRTFNAAEFGRYSTCANLKDDLLNAAAFLVSLMILQNSQYENITYYDDDTTVPMMSVANETSMPRVTRAMPATQQMGGKKTPSGGRPSSYKTNNQVDRIDEGDLVKTDGVNVFVGYGDAIVVWDAATGIELSRTVITPAAAIPGAGDPPFSYYSFPPPPLYVRTLFLEGHRLVVIVDGYDTFLSGNSGQSIIQPNGSTKVHLFDITNIPRDGSELTHLTEEELPGNFLNAYIIGHYLHYVGTSYWDTYTYLYQPFSRWNREFAGLSSTEYITAAVAVSDEAIRNHVTKLMSELVVTNSCENIPQLALFLEGSDSDGDFVSIDAASNAGILNGLAYITTINTHFDAARQKNLHLATTEVPISFTWSVITYTNDGYLFMVNPGGSTSKNNQYRPASFILAYTLSPTGKSARIQSVGVVPGSVYDQFWLDYFHGHLRVASTAWSNYGCTHEEVFISGYYNYTDCGYGLLDESINRITILKVPTDRSNRLQQVGLSENLGSSEYASINSVRFVQDKAFVSISDLNSSFYTINMQNPAAPEVSGTVDVDISGFYDQFQFVVTEGNFIIAVGQNNNSTGPQLNLIDTTDLGSPVLIQQYNSISSLADTFSYEFSQVELNYKAVRWVPSVRKLVLPLHWWFSSNFNTTDYFTSESFMVFDVTTEQIELDFEVSHWTAQESQIVCWNDVHLPSRSLVIDGVLTTIAKDTVVATSLDSKEEVFLFNLDNDVNKTACQ